MQCFRKSARFLCLCLACAALFCSVGVSAVESDRTGSIACLSYVDGHKVADVKCQLWQVASYDAGRNAFELLDWYKQYHIGFDPSDVDVMTRFTKTLYDYVRRDNIRVDKTAVSDFQGVALFELLQPGVYLITAEEFEHDGKLYTGQPMLVYIPNLSDDGVLVFSAEVELKFTGRRIPEKPVEEKISRRVLKTWRGDDRSERPESIAVELLKDGKVYDTVELTAENSWRYVWTDLDKNADWSIVEQEVPEGYETYTDLKGVTFVIENVKETPPPDIPPEEPPETPPETPWTPPGTDPGPGPENPPTDTWTPPGTPWTPPTTPQVPNDPKIPQTGQLWWPVPVLTIAGLGVLLAGVFCRRREDL